MLSTCISGQMATRSIVPTVPDDHHESSLSRVNIAPRTSNEFSDLDGSSPETSIWSTGFLDSHVDSLQYTTGLDEDKYR